ncbi:MAG: amidohydrolase family protein [Deltaproteobacteria bacterium]|nr:amidohydrolase family protein [Deltaproteobacteria bacterium]
MDEAISAVTRAAARAVGRADLGRLYVGAPCDAVVLRQRDPEALLYEMAGQPVATVVKGGRLVWRDPALGLA